MKKPAILTLIAFVFIAACATRAPIPLDEGADNVQVSKTEPGEGYKIVGLITAIDGKGCGDFGIEGNRENAITIIKNDAHALGGDYAQLLNVTEPHVSGGCYDNKYIINATAFKKTDGTETAAQVEDAPTTTQPTGTEAEDFTKKLRELKALRDDGILSEQEYQQQKQRLLEKGI